MLHFLILATAVVCALHVPRAFSDNADGAVLYQKFCANCHAPDANGQPLWYPSLRNIIESRSVDDLVVAIDAGQFRRAGEQDLGDVAGHTIPIMPAWAWLSDAEMASLINFLVTRFSDSMIRISTEEVELLRRPGDIPGLTDSDRLAAERIYLRSCVGCHGTRRGGVTGPALSTWPLRTLPDTHIRSIIHYGSNQGMPGLGVEEALTAHQIELLVSYLKEPQINVPEFTDTQVADSHQLLGEGAKRTGAARPLYVTLLNDPGSVLITDAESKEVLQEVKTAWVPHDVATANGYLYVVSKGGWVTQIDLRAEPIQAVARIRVGYEARSLHLSTDGKTLTVATTSPGGITVLAQDRLALDSRSTYKHREPHSFIDLGSELNFALDRREPCLYRVNGKKLSNRCIKSVAYARYATNVPNSDTALVVAEEGYIGIVDLKKKKLLKTLTLDEAHVPSHGSFFEHPDYGQVFILGSMTGSQIYLIGADSEHPEHLWQIVERMQNIGAGSLYTDTHPNASYIATDAPLNTNPEIANAIYLISKENLETRNTIEMPDLPGTPRALHPTFSTDGREIWVTIWNRQDEPGALVVLDSTSGEVIKVIKDRRLTTPIRTFAIDG